MVKILPRQCQDSRRSAKLDLKSLQHAHDLFCIVSTAPFPPGIYFPVAQDPSARQLLPGTGIARWKLQRYWVTLLKNAVPPGRPAQVRRGLVLYYQSIFV